VNSIKKIFLTGASGCVGHYLIDEFLADEKYHLILLVRDSRKLRRDILESSKVTLVEAALEDFSKYAPFLKEVDFIIHVATSWGGSFEVNYDLPLKIFEEALGYKCQKVIHFSTASILDEKNQILAPGRQHGSEYIKSKLKLYEAFQNSPRRRQIITIFPTLVLGGDSRHPYSYISQALPVLKKWFWWLRFFKIDAGFHLIHAVDVAGLVKYFIENEMDQQDYVLGYSYLTADQLLKQLAEIFRKKIYFQISLPVNFLIKLAQLFGATFLPWDLYCARHHRHFRYQVVGPADFGLPRRFKDKDLFD